MIQKISRYKLYGFALPCIVLVVVFHSIIFAFLTGGTHTPQAQGSPTPMSITSSSHNPTVVESCFDTPPLYSSTLAHAAAVAIAELIV